VDDAEYLVRVKGPASQLLLLDGGLVRAPHKSMVDWLTGIGDKCAAKTGFVRLAVKAQVEHV
jgi:hypothetical protein